MYMDAVSDTTCSFCRNEQYTTSHTLWRCVAVKPFCEQLEVSDGCLNATSVQLNDNITFWGL